MNDSKLLELMDSLTPSEAAIRKALITLSVERPNVKNLVEAVEVLFRAKIYETAVSMLTANGREKPSGREVAEFLFTPKSTVDRFPHITNKEVIYRAQHLQVRKQYPRKRKSR